VTAYPCPVTLAILASFALTCRENLFRLFAEDFLGFLHQSAFAKLSIILVRFANAILESRSFPVYIYEWICVLLIFHDVSPVNRILLQCRKGIATTGSCPSFIQMARPEFKLRNCLAI
jgi:hypothetical protein